ncbi:hypothetical protein [Burkholderia cenocepacia]|uniref:hypothetical protein n=1 Tax=Burkholderia cenocepacia TaxID=95486 RepID=UPI0009808D6E|nr:hypothetical protein [Burkholderia cenocepacia]ONY02712.1 hypothetical protein A8F26_11410 [Burkholderia cenocepacia]ONY15543.1 hypothetical protein A8F25_10900 [Burkholderia cenocepacia]ONY35266.1 hypothetical protein A8F29_12145 [Burkholderia cenocepacia]ONY46495.1 hypothetical protein A8F28_09030 [Burkholderia cenocepacia]ONY53206.1 hypothetical protein A8F24_12530 [Burkholderia cenocepacia]
MTSKNTGLLIYFDENRRRDLIRQKVEGSYEPFSDALSVYDWDIGQLNIALLCFSEVTIDYIAIAKKGRRVATSKSKVEFSSLVNLSQVPLPAIESRLTNRLKQYFIKASQGIGGAIPDTTWSVLVDAIKLERPGLAGEIDRLLALRRYSGLRLSGQSAEILIQEREALGISLDIFSGSNQLREHVLTEWAPSEGFVEEINEDDSSAKLANLPKGQSLFLMGIPKRYLQEESAIQHDLFNWPGMTSIHESGVSVFKQGNRSLNVLYANRNDLEHTLGVDLIYYNEFYGLFVLVQYKLMSEEGGGFVYRPDAQFASELERMDNFYKEIHSDDAIRSHADYRLSDDGFMMKMVPNRGLQPASGELVKGMYLPRKYVHYLLSPSGPKGPRGGVQITFEDAPRYLTNSQFSASVHDGWIGTRGAQSETLKKMIRNFYETGRAILIAVETKDVPQFTRKPWY